MDLVKFAQTRTDEARAVAQFRVARTLRAWAQRLDPQPVTVTSTPNGGSVINFSGVPTAEITHGMINDLRRIKL